MPDPLSVALAAVSIAALAVIGCTHPATPPDGFPPLPSAVAPAANVQPATAPAHG